MAESSNNRWEWVKTVLTVASVVIATLAYFQSRNATEQSRITSEKQSQLANQSLAIQKKTFDRQNPMLRIGFIQVWLQSPDNGKYLAYPDRENPEHIVVPIEEWTSVSERWLNFSIENPGAVPIYVEDVGIGANETQLRWANAADVHCKDKVNPDNWLDKCPREIGAATEQDYSIYLTRDLLANIDPSWQDRGLEVCVKIETFNATCDTSWAALPHDFLDALSPAPGG